VTERIIEASLTSQDVAAVAGGAWLRLSHPAQDRIAHAGALVDVIVERGLRCYGVNTGVGALADVLVDQAQQSALSHNILMSHACGVGEPLPVKETRAVMACAINNFAHGASGVRPVVVDRLLALLNANFIPLVPRLGSIGYITYMAHIALVLIGAGSVRCVDGVISGAEALQRLAVPPLVLAAKEGLSLVNGTPDTSGLASVALERLSRLLGWADVVAAMTFENIGHNPAVYAPEALRFTASEAVSETGRRLSRLLSGSEVLSQARTRTQDAMSLRAVPQVHGAVRESLAAGVRAVDRELASVTDNPIVAGTLDAPVAYAGAFAIASALALSLDALAIAVAKIAAMSERRIDRMVNPLVSGLPPFLARDAGVSSGFMIAQYTALGLVSENRRLAAPSSLDGGVSSGLQEDEIPHATTGALRLLTIVDNLETILAIELLAAAQCYEFQDPTLARAPATDAIYRSLRKVIAPYADDRPLATDVAAAIDFLRREQDISVCIEK
jgi:histidine ammonia-lyase